MISQTKHYKLTLTLCAAMMASASLLLSVAAVPIVIATASLFFVDAANAVEVELDTGETIELDQAVVQKCQDEGLSLGACACVVSIMLEEEETTSLSLAQMVKQANDYPDEYEEASADCKSVN